MNEEWDTNRYLADPAELAVRAGLPADDPGITQAIARATARFRGAVGHPVSYHADGVFHLSGDGGKTLALPVAPIDGMPRVSINGAELPPGSYGVARRAGVLRRAGGWPDGLENIEVRVGHGYRMIPADIQDAILEAAEIDLNRAGAAGIDTITTGDETIRFSSSRTATGGAAGATVLWADTVSRYRIGWDGDGI